MNNQIANAIKHARGYWFVDGFIEIVAGIFFVLLAGLLIFSLGTSDTSLPSWFVSAAVSISIAKLIGIVAAILILWWLKDRFTYPRTGFVRGKKITKVQMLGVIRNAVVFLLLPILSLLAASLFIASTAGVLSSMPVWFPVGIASLWAILLALAAGWLGLRRFRIMGAIILLAGIGIGIWQYAVGLPGIPANIDPGTLEPQVFQSINRSLVGLSYLIVVSGVTLIFSGILTFLNYRKENPIPYAEDL